MTWRLNFSAWWNNQLDARMAGRSFQDTFWSSPWAMPARSWAMVTSITPDRTASSKAAFSSAFRLLVMSFLPRAASPEALSSAALAFLNAKSRLDATVLAAEAARLGAAALVVAQEEGPLVPVMGAIKGFDGFAKIPVILIEGSAAKRLKARLEQGEVLRVRASIVTSREALYSGTSMASPHVAGAAALLRSQGITNPAAIEAALERFAADLGAPGRDPEFGFGLIDVRAALLGLGYAK